jgi:hypothetical protein
LRARLGNPERCVAEAPELRQTASGHLVSCHFAEEVDGSPEQGLQVKGADGRTVPAPKPGAAPSGPASPVVPPSAPQATQPAKPAKN